MKKLLLALTILVSVCGNANADWSGDTTNAFYSNTVITDIHVGQINKSEYFCIKYLTEDKQKLSACSVQKETAWNAPYYSLLSQARYFYSTGQRIRVYIVNNVWTYDKFYQVFSKALLVGLSSCEDIKNCFGPAYTDKS
ncbi:subtilase family AB5 toxin binding subunit [Yersinia enterocolitica]|uniref:subtilase family AB5 toxin binding subunit n=1 Tax=Yersinia enterocolitica TaxID=630 RepID=UPI001C8D37CC|nr:subtilase family AB5 toxin binding subunit [Yersinia enterocolitica]MBX9477490.1 subtilase cytotoxin subunit B [Yersinia enterocolitica]